MKSLKHILLGIAMVCGAGSAAADLATAGRQLAKDVGPAVVHVTAVIKISVEGPLAAAIGGSQEQKSEALATIIDPSGLAVVAESALNPTVLMGNVKIMGQTLKMSAALSDVKYRLADGTEIPAKVILKDEDLDLAFVAPAERISTEDKKKFAVINLKNAAAQPKLLDEFIQLSRLNEQLNYETTVRHGRITAVIRKPRTFYTGSSSIGAPVFTLDGKVLGLCMMRRDAKTGHHNIGIMGTGAQPSGSVVIVPAEYIELITQQALEEME